MRYEESSSSEEEFFTCREPEFVCDLHNGYIQMLQACYYQGTSRILSGGSMERSYFVLENPKDSNVNVFINKALHSNLSSSAIAVTTYLCSRVKGELRVSECIDNTNTYFSKKQAKARIVYGREAIFKENNANTRFSIPPYGIYSAIPSGSIVLAPGKCYVAEAEALEGSLGFDMISSLGWWECVVRECKCK
ncbi:MAG: hypothetical protein E7256_04565 [Lachnospiraceae bacterium]|nr:hypothetical protein [Lachnospiraceae bacterium]